VDRLVEIGRCQAGHRFDLLVNVAHSFVHEAKPPCIPKSSPSRIRKDPIELRLDVTRHDKTKLANIEKNIEATIQQRLIDAKAGKRADWERKYILANDPFLPVAYAGANPNSHG
jgi:hypothetical protein